MPSKKKELLDYLNTANTSYDNLRVPTAEDLVDTGRSSYLIEKDFSKYKDYLSKQGDVIHDSPDTWDDKRAEAQSSGAKFVNSVGQMLGTFGTSLASTVTALGSGVAALGAEAATLGEAEGMDIFLNNPIMKGISDFDKYLKEDVVPTYYTKEQQESLFSASTGTDLLNGVGFLASNILPNAAVVKTFGSWAKVAALNKLGRLSPEIQALTQAEKLTTQEAALISKTAAFLNKSGPVVGAVVGRIGESAIESYDTYQSTKESLTAERNRNRQQLELYGSPENEEMANLSDEDIEKRAKEARNNVFGGNMALAVSDMAQFTRWFKGPGIGERLAKEGIKTVAKQYTKKEGLAKLGKDLLFEAGQEAGEEGFQFLLQKGAEKQAKTGQSFWSGINESTDELFGTVEGQKSMLLGAILGGGMSRLMALKNRGEIKQQVQQAIQQYNSLGDTKERYVVNEKGERVINPELNSVATKFMEYEKLKEEAKQKGNLSEYELLEKLQFSSLVLAKKNFGDYDSFIDELESMSNLTTEEAEQYFGELPTRNGRKISPQEIVQEKVQFAKKISRMMDGLNRIESINPLLPKYKNHVASYILNQESIREQIVENNSKINELKGKTSFNPITEEMDLDPFDAAEIKKLELTNEVLKNKFQEFSKEVTSLISKPEKIVKEVDENEEQEVEDLVDEIENEQIKQQNELSDIINNQETVTIETPEGPQEIKIVGLDEETGNPIDEQGNVYAPEQILEAKEKETEQNEPESQDTIPDDYIENSQLEESPKKPNIMATSTRGHSYGKNGKNVEKFTERTGSPTGEVKYSIYPQHADMVVKMSDPNNTPSDNKKYEIEVSIEPLNSEQKEAKLLEINEHRKNRKIGGPLTLADLESEAHIPLLLTITENGKVFTNDILHFHDINYIVETAEYERAKSVEEKEAIKAEYLAKRAEIVKALKEGKKVTIPVDSKSTGMINYNPLINGKRQVNPLIGGKSIGVFNHIKPKGKAKGIGVITNVDEDSVTIEFSDNTRQTIPNQLVWAEAIPGKVIFHTVAANNTPLVINAITYNKYSKENLDSIANLFVHRLFNGNTLNKGNKKFEIVNSNKTGILNQLVYLGNNTNAPEKGIYFTKAGNLRVGRNEFTPESDPNKVRQALDIFLGTYAAYPKVAITGLDSDIILPSQISDSGEITSDETTQKVWEFLFKGDNPLVGSDVNSDINFINSYFVFGEPKIEQTQPEEYGKELSNEVKVPEVKIETPVSDIEAKKADIERRRQEAIINAFSTPISFEEFNKAWEKGFPIVKGTQLVDKSFTNILVDGKAYEYSKGKFYPAFPSSSIDVQSTERADWLEKQALTITDLKGKKIRRDLYQYNVMAARSLTRNNLVDFIKASKKEDILNDINAKYDAELAALEGAKPVETQAKTKIPEVNVDPILEHKNQDCNGTGGKGNPLNPPTGGKKFIPDDDW